MEVIIGTVLAAALSAIITAVISLVNTLKSLRNDFHTMALGINTVSLTVKHNESAVHDIEDDVSKLRDRVTFIEGALGGTGST